MQLLPAMQGDALSAFGGAGGPIILPSFAFEAQTETLAATFTAAPTTRRKKTINKFIKRMKNYPAGDPVWPRLIGFWKVGADTQSTAKNWVTPGTYDLVAVGTSTFSADNTYGTSGTSYFKTGILCNALPVDDYSMGFFMATVSNPSDGSADMGGKDATNGLSISARNVAAGTMAARCGGAVVTTIGTSAIWDAEYFHAISRNNSATFDAYKGPRKVATLTNASAALPAQEIYVLGLNNNGSFTAPTKTAGCWFVGKSMSEAQMKELSGAITQLHLEMSQGEIDTYEVGVQPQNVTAYDVVVYGATAQGVVAAYEAKRQGRAVCIVGGYRDRTLGGMSAGGLGFYDVSTNTTAASTVTTGLPKYIIARIRALNSTSNYYFEPRHFDQVMREMVDPSRTGGLDIPVYWSDGVVSTVKSGTRVTSMTTADGRAFTAKKFIDCTYEGDLLYCAGCSYVVGRDAAGSGSEAAAGYRGIDTTYSVPNQAVNHAGTTLNIDPYIEPGNPASGLIDGVTGTYVAGTPAVGTADTKIQAMAFRATVTTLAPYLVPFPSTPPTGYATSKFELLLRLLGSDATLVMADIFNMATVATGVFDVNHRNIMSNDYISPLATEYATATYTRRKAIWVEHQRYFYGLWYLLQYDPDSRVPTALRTQALTYGLSSKHYCRPYDTDEPYFMTQLYVRTPSRRLVTDFLYNGPDFNMADGTTPRSIKTVGAAAYTFDRHAVQYLADPNAGTPRVIMEGSISVTTTGGTNNIAPLPYEIIVPKTTECTNLFSVFSVGCSDIAQTGIRLEGTTIALAQAAGLAAAMTIENGDQDVQVLDYPSFRTRYLASPALTGETAPYLPQTN